MWNLLDVAVNFELGRFFWRVDRMRYIHIHIHTYTHVRTCLKMQCLYLNNIHKITEEKKIIAPFSVGIRLRHHTARCGHLFLFCFLVADASETSSMWLHWKGRLFSSLLFSLFILSLSFPSPPPLLLPYPRLSAFSITSTVPLTPTSPFRFQSLLLPSDYSPSLPSATSPPLFSLPSSPSYFAPFRLFVAPFLFPLLPLLSSLPSTPTHGISVYIIPRSHYYSTFSYLPYLLLFRISLSCYINRK